MEWHGLTTREWATVFYVSVLVVLCLVLPSWRAIIAPAVRQFLHWKIQATIFALLAWTALVLYVGRLVGAWDADLLKDTIAWLFVSGLSTLFSTIEAPKQDRFFRSAALSAISVGVLMQFLLNLHTFNIVFELLLQPFLVFLILLSAAAHTKPDTVRVGKLVDWLIAIFGLLIVIATGRGLLNSWRGVNPKETGLTFAFSVWLPLAMLPFVYAVALGQTYGKIFTLSSFRNDRKKPPLLVRAAMVYGLGGNLRGVNDLPRFGTYSLISRSRGFREALGHVRDYERERQRSIADKDLEADRLEWYAGNKGRRADGTLLDQREFRVTTDALRWLATCHQAGRAEAVRPGGRPPRHRPGSRRAHPRSDRTLRRDARAHPRRPIRLAQRRGRHELPPRAPLHHPVGAPSNIRGARCTAPGRPGLADDRWRLRLHVPQARPQQFGPGRT